jgi:hypothetical protein
MSWELALSVICALFPFGWYMLKLPQITAVGIISWVVCIGLLVDMGRKDQRIMRWLTAPFARKIESDPQFSWDDNFGPEARITVKNRGEASDFVASARIIKITEPAPNTRRMQSFALTWIDSGTSTTHIPHDAEKSIRIARAEGVRQERGLNEMFIVESRAEGQTDLEGIRWHTITDEPPQVVLEVSVVRVAPPSRASKKIIAVEGGRYGGIRVAKQAAVR